MALTQKNRELLVYTSFAEDFLLLSEFSASETVSELFSFQLKLVHEETTRGLTPTVVDPQDVLGKSITVKTRLADKTSRCFNGVVSHWQQGNRDTRFTHYQAIVVPKVWLLTQRSQSRIFQRLSVPQILRKVLAGFNVKYELVGNFNQREYCVQYQESDWAFASRLMEEEGIYYYFQHSLGEHKMIVADTPQSHRDCPSKKRIPFEADLTRIDGSISSITAWETNYRLQTGKVTVWDHNFELPHKKLEAGQPSLYQVADNSSLEIFQYPGAYAKRYTGVDNTGGDQTSELQNIFDDNRQQAVLQMQAIDGRYKIAEGSSNCCSLTAGHKFEIFNHSLKQTNGEYMLTNVTHHALQSPALSTEKRVDDAYRNTFNCIPLKSGSTPFRPLRKTPKARISGSQTAVVVGPAGEEIFTDKYGRIKVQFHWDRDGKYDVGSSCWMRVSQPWAGAKWGSICIPRIGQEVIVEFLEGDPDQPIVTGSVYNPQQMPPYSLPANANMMGMKSNTTKGGGGYNEIVIVDGKEGEMIRTHAQKDRDTTVLNDDTRTVFRNRDVKVFGWQKEEITGDMTTIVTEGNQSNKVSQGSQTDTVKKDIIITSETGAIILKAETQIVLQVGENKIVITKDALISLFSKGTITSQSDNVTVIKGSQVVIN